MGPRQSVSNTSNDMVSFAVFHSCLSRGVSLQSLGAMIRNMQLGNAQHM